LPLCLILVSRAAMLEEAIVLAGALEQRTPGSATVVLSGELTPQDAARVSACGARVAVDQSSPALPVSRRFWRRLVSAGPMRALRRPLAVARRRKEVEAMLSRLGAQVLVVFEDRIPEPEMVWLDAAARRSIPAMLVRYASSSAESDAWSRKGKAAYSLEHGVLAWARRMFAKAYPGHALDLGMGRQIFYSLWDSIGLALAGMANTQPWIAGGGQVSLAAVQGRVDYDDAVRTGCAPERLRITGQPSWDALARIAEDRDRIRSALHRAPDLKDIPLIICALPQWGEHHQLPWPEHMEKITQLCALLQASGCTVLLSLHPKADRGIYRELAERHGLRIADQALSAILPAADVFIASWSSTLRWAAMLGVPSINLDWAGQDYQLFAELKSLPLSRSPEDLPAILDKLASDPARRQALGAGLRGESVDYGAIDGKAGQRILSLVENLAGKRHS
jgi:hypothetical protein